MHNSNPEWFDKLDITMHRGIHPSSIKRIRREGLLNGTDLINLSGKPYYTIYLVSENEQFLKQYPKIPS